MLWLLIFHISTMLLWCASLIYMPALAAGVFSRKTDIEQHERRFIPRHIFTLVATPLALLTIIFGTLIFLINGTTSVWLILKLTLVSALVVCHVLNGWLILHIEKPGEMPPPHLREICLILGIVSASLIAAIIWLVLAKPLREYEVAIREHFRSSAELAFNVDVDADTVFVNEVTTHDTGQRNQKSGQQ